MKCDSSLNSSEFQPENLYYRNVYVHFKKLMVKKILHKGTDERWAESNSFLSVFETSISALLEGNLKTSREKWFIAQPNHTELKLKLEKMKLKSLFS